MTKYQYQQGQEVFYNLDGNIKGWAKICGAATDEMAVIGRTWIIEAQDPIPFSKNVYPFSHITAFDCQLDSKEFGEEGSTWSQKYKNQETETKTDEKNNP